MIFNNRNQFKKNLIVVCLSVFFILLFSHVFITELSAAKNPASDISTPGLDFPTYPAIKPNIKFWIKIFTKFSKAQGVIHDSKNLDIIYDVIDLDDSNTLRASKINKKRKKRVIKKYKTILLNLSKGGNSVSTKETQKVIALFGPNAKPEDFKKAAHRLRCQTGIKEQFKKGLKRSGAFIDEFKRIFRSHGLPVDLIYLPCVESSYNFNAYSKFGAAGIWQFTHSTGRQYMKINYVVDERRDPYISTDAAARLLKKNYAHLKNWPMAITAYNHGLNGMKRAKNSKGSYEKIVKSYHSRSFKFASRNFYSEFLAARIVGKNPEKYFGSIRYDKPVSFKIIKTKGYLSVRDLTETFSFKIQQIKKLNPALRKTVFLGQKYIPKGYKLHLPINIPAKNFNKRLTSLYKNKQKPSRFHRVKKGDTAGSIARTHSVKLHDLILANGLSRKATIYIGQNLRIPVQNGSIAAKRKNKITAKKEIPKKNKAKQVNVKKLKPKIKQADKPVVETPAKPAKSNISINPNIVTANLNVLKTFVKGDTVIGIIKVETEETLGHYANWLKIPTQTIRSLNNFKYGQQITVDQKIKISFKKVAAQKFEEQRYEYHKEIEEDFFESFAIQGVETYIIKNGDNTWKICLNELEIPFWLLKKYNTKIDFNALQPGQTVNYPLIIKSKQTR